MRHRLFARLLDRKHVHAVDDFAGDAEGLAAVIDVLGRGRARLRGAHGVLVVLDHEDHRQAPERGHVERLIDLALVGGTIPEIGEGDAAVVLVLVGKGEAGADRHLGTDDAVTAVEMLLFREHVHRAALALGIAALAPRELGHHALWVHAAGQHMAVIAVGGDPLVAFLGGGLEPDDDGLLSDIEMAEPADQTHAVKLACLFLESADEQHVSVISLQLVGGNIRFRCAFAGGHSDAPPPWWNGLTLNHFLHETFGVCEAEFPRHVLAAAECSSPPPRIPAP